MNGDIVIRYNYKTAKYRIKLPMVPSLSNPQPYPSSFWLVDMLTGDIAEFDTLDEVMTMLLRHYGTRS